LKKKHSVVIIVFAVVAVIAIVTARILSTSQGAKGASSQGAGRGAPVAVETAKMSTRSMTDIREFSGAVKASYTYVVSAKVPGRLLNIYKRIGDEVKSNEIIAKIDDTEYRNALDEAQTQVRVSKASLDESKAQLNHTERELERARGLLEKGIVSKAEFDGLSTQFETQKSRSELAEAQLEQRQVVLSQARTNFEYTQVRAAKAGFVAQRHIDGGTLLSTGSAVVTIVGIDTVFVELAVTEKDYRSINQGKKAAVTTSAVPGKSFEGEVFRVAPFFQSASRTAAVEIALKNDSHLLMPGMSARINIVLESDENAKVVPSAALVEKDGVNAIFVVDDSLTAKFIPVTVGINDGKYAQILSPTDIEGQIVTLGQHLLRDGSKVIIHEKNPEKKKDELAMENSK